MLRPQKLNVFVLGSIALLISAPCKAEQVVRVATVKLIIGITPYFYERYLPADYKVEVVPFESPVDVKNAVVTGAADFGVQGLASHVIGASNGEKIRAVASVTNKGLGYVSRVGSGIDKVSDLKGKRVGIAPGTTQSIMFEYYLQQAGMTSKDFTTVRIAMNEMPAALARGDLDAFLGSEPGVSLSVNTGVGRVFEYPWNTPIGDVNIVMTANTDVISTNPDLVRRVVAAHRDATKALQADKELAVTMGVAKLSQPRDTLSLALKTNVEYVWNIDDAWVAHVNAYASKLLDMKMIKNLPSPDFVDRSFVSNLPN